LGIPEGDLESEMPEGAAPQGIPVVDLESGMPEGAAP